MSRVAVLTLEASVLLMAPALAQDDADQAKRIEELIEHLGS